MTAKFWVAKYVEDPVRNEPRNVGVVVEKAGVYISRFLGERDDGQFDARRIKALRYADVYGQWRNYWREQVVLKDIEGLLVASPNYYMTAGGEVADTGSDTPAEVCQFLYSMLVSAGGVVEAFGWSQDEESEIELETELESAFNDLRVLATGSLLLAKHPVVAQQRIQGVHVAHVPSFSQRNGQLHLIEHIDLGSSRVNKTKERAGWMAYMFSDIKGAEGEAQAYSIVRPPRENANGAIEYARTVLMGESRVVNWSDACERENFLSERKRIAEHV